MMRIGLIGAPGAGKDAVADFLVDKKGFDKIAFADQIKKEYYIVSGYSEAQFKAARHTSLENTIRAGLWDYSDKAKKEHGDYYFIQPVIDTILQSPNNIVVSDIRTDLEILKMKEIGAQLIVISRDYDKDLSKDKIPGTKLTVDKVRSCKVIRNNFNTLDELHIELENFYEKEIKGYGS